ncbi:hypothetical protein BDV95DRAFT_487102 [Massariosphaeria phaeospora]|uniref:C2H2-type domain-containing protein n=1 Tax=Massariosphaeria phaeospora TaxID=100035 RepID=A0A7C8IIJ0_9PLEO|nr:hypothetical protein BDV95DRAFT_487102 [Massariosphaeria phaeospora]
MPIVRVGARDLLEYDARYGVLICRECQYAIQKSALQSHLLRHKIYRDERQCLLSSIAELPLHAPEDVPLPSPNCPPIDALPLISGYRCTAAACGNLCASTKRMRRHWSELHGLSELSSSSQYARPVTLQTFFRGTKIKYFEVSPSAVATGTGAAPLAAITVDDEDERCYDEGQNKYADITMPLRQPLPHITTTSDVIPTPSSTSFDLGTLIYFHHFTTTTSLTLPCTGNLQSATHYWQTDVVALALRQRWLMCGLLAISACHLAVLTDDASIKLENRECSAQFFSDFSFGWKEADKRHFGITAAGDDDVRKAGGQISCILRCVHWTLAESPCSPWVDTESASPFHLQSIMTTLRDFVLADSGADFGDILADSRIGQGEAFARASRIISMRSSSATRNLSMSFFDSTPSTLLNRISTLPTRLAETLGKPDDIKEVMVVLSATAALVEYCDSSFTSDEVEVAWHSMTAWLSRIPDHFHYLISIQEPAALAVLAYWAASLVKRAEQCGCWFMNGTAKIILLQITEQLGVNRPGALSLVEGLVV